MGRYEAMTRYAVSSVSHGMSPRMYGRVTEEVPRARQCCSDACVLGYVSMSEEVNIKGRRIKVNPTELNPLYLKIQQKIVGLLVKICYRL